MNLIQKSAFDVVGAQNVALRCDDAPHAVRQEVHPFRVRRVFRAD